MSFFAQVFNAIVANDRLDAMMVERLESSSKEEIEQLYSILQLPQPTWPFDENVFFDDYNRFYSEEPSLIVTTFVRLNDLEGVSQYLESFDDEVSIDAYFLAIDLGYIDIARMIWFRRFVTSNLPHPIFRRCRGRQIMTPWAYAMAFRERRDPVGYKNIFIAQRIDSDSNLPSKHIAYTVFTSLCDRQMENLEKIKDSVSEELKDHLRLRCHIDFIRPFTSEECMTYYLNFLN